MYLSPRLFNLVQTIYIERRNKVVGQRYYNSTCLEKKMLVAVIFTPEGMYASLGKVQLHCRLLHSTQEGSNPGPCGSHAQTTKPIQLLITLFLSVLSKQQGVCMYILLLYNIYFALTHLTRNNYTIILIRRTEIFNTFTKRQVITMTSL